MIIENSMKIENWKLEIDNYCSAFIVLVISIISLVMLACRALLNSSVRSSASSPALSDAVFIATMRAECSEAFASNIK